MALYAGFAEIEITPPLGTWMGGYAFRPSGCAAIHDPLFARAAVFQHAGKAVAILAMDLIGLDGETVEAVRAGVEKETGIPPAAVMLNGSHTHGGPLTKAFRGRGTRDARYIGWLTRSLIDLVKQAARTLSKASLAHGRAPVRIGVNRRQYGERPEDTRIGVNPAGPFMPWVDAIVVRDGRDRPAAVLFSHACHPTTLGGDNLAVTADYCGYACDTIRRVAGDDVMPLFLQGCSGNINPHPRGDFGWAKRHGETLGEAALTAIRRASSLNSRSLDFALETIDLMVEPPPPQDACEREVLQWEEAAAKWRGEGDVGQEMHAEGLRDHALFEWEAASLGEDQEFVATFDIQRLSLGPVQVLGFPAEMFVQYALDFDRQAEGPVISLGITNGVHGYVPVAADYPHGGYEVRGAHRYYGVLPFDRSCERDIRRAAYDLLGIRNPDRTPYGIGPNSPPGASSSR
jgi:hypothetical protein